MKHCLCVKMMYDFMQCIYSLSFTKQPGIYLDSYSTHQPPQSPTAIRSTSFIIGNTLCTNITYKIPNSHDVCYLKF